MTLDWMQPGRGGWTYFAGAFTARSGDSEWTVGHVGLLSRATDRVTIQGDLQWGSGRRNGEGFDVSTVSGAVVWEMVDRRLFLAIEDRYLDIDTTRGNLVQAAVTLVPGDWLSWRVAYLLSTSGNVDSEFVTSRVDFFSGGLHYLAGVAFGSSRPEVLDLTAGDASDLEQAFVGLAFPLRSVRLTLVLDHLRMDAGERRAITASLWVPWKRKPSR